MFSVPLPRRAGYAAAFALVLSSFVTAVSAPARAVTLDFATLGIDPGSLVDVSVLSGVIAVIGFGTQHRPYEPATALGIAVGLDISLEATFFKIPDSLFENLSSFGLPSKSPLPALPVAKLHLHKGFSDRFDVGISGLYLRSNYLVGGDAKFVIVEGEEGPTYALRFCYSYAKAAFNAISLSTQTYSPQLLVSRKMEFADPYLGVAMAYTRGAVTATISKSMIPAAQQAQIPPGVDIEPTAYTFPVSTALTSYMFGGVSLRIPHSGLRLTLEGAYDLSGVSTMGTKIGFTF